MTGDRRIRKTRAAIDRAMLALMRKKDFDKITVQDIAAAADVNRATFYHHFSDKYDWLDQFVASLLGDLFAQARRSYGGQADQRQTFLAACRHFDENYEVYSLLLHNRGTVYFEQRLQGALLEEFRRRNRTGQQRDASFELAAHFSAGAVVASFVCWIEQGRPIPVPEFSDRLYAIYQSMPPWLRV